MPRDAQRCPAGLRPAESRLDTGMYRQSYSEGNLRAAIRRPAQNTSTPSCAVAQEVFLTNTVKRLNTTLFTQRSANLRDGL